MAARKNRTAIEWVGGLVSMPGYVTGEGEPYRPEALLWMGDDGAVLGHAVGKPGELVGLACESLRTTALRPMYGRPHAPARVRVASLELAEVLRAGQSGIEVVCAPTPEIDAVLASMREGMAGDGEAEQSYLSPEVGPAAVAAFFRAAATLFRAKPWKTVPSDHGLFSLTIEKFGVQDAAVSVIGQMGQSFGLVVFSGVDDFDAYLDAADAMEHGEEPAIPPHLSFNFERGAELSTALRKEIAEHHWEVANAAAYPWLVAIDEDLIARSPTAEEFTIAEAIALALPKVLKQKKALLAAWNGGEPVVRTLIVPTHAGDVEVKLRFPCEQEPAGYEPATDVVTALMALGRRGGEIDAEAREPLEDELVSLFAASPEAKMRSQAQWCRCLMDLAARYFGATVATLDAARLRELVFEVIPRHVSVEARASGEIIDEFRAFYRFLGRAFALKQADACLRVLAGASVRKLEAALADSSKFGPAKSLFMAGREAGFDMNSKAGIEAWMRVMQSQPLPASVRLPSPGAAARPTDKASARAKKKSRKSARKARKKNR